MSSPLSTTLKPFSDSGQAAVEGAAAQRDVVLLAAGEVDEVRAPRGGRADHEVDLRSVGEHDAALVDPAETM